MSVEQEDVSVWAEPSGVVGVQVGKGVERMSTETAQMLLEKLPAAIERATAARHYFEEAVKAAADEA